MSTPPSGPRPVEWAPIPASEGRLCIGCSAQQDADRYHRRRVHRARPAIHRLLSDPHVTYCGPCKAEFGAGSAL